MDNGSELMDFFTSWINSVTPIKEGTARMNLSDEQKERTPFLLYEGCKWVIGKEGANRGFDGVYSAVNKKNQVEINIPVEFKSNKDKLDGRLTEQIQRHITVFGFSCVVLDDKIGVDLLGFPEKFFWLIPAYIFVKKGNTFKKISVGTIEQKIPGFYTNNISNLLPYGLKGSAEQLTIKFELLDDIMRKLYTERMRTSLYKEDHDAILFTDDELKVMETLLITANTDGAIQSFKDAIQCLEKLNKWHFKKGGKDADSSHP